MKLHDSIPGLNGKLYWFNAVVENTSDPRKMGRMQIRVLGKDTEKLDKQPSKLLAWAVPLHPLTGTHMSLDVKPGDWVWGFYIDDKVAQNPIILGVYPGIKRVENDPTQGFSDQRTDEQKKEEPDAPPGVIVAGKEIESITGSPQTAQGKLEGTLIEQTNKDVVHVCDIATQLKRSVIWERLKHTQFVTLIRDAIQGLITALGNSPDSLSQKVVEFAQWLRLKLKWIQDKLKLATDYLQITVEVATQLRAIADWILSLPARLQAALSNCLSAFLSGIGSLVSDALTLPSASGTNITEILNEVKKTTDQAGQTITAAITLLAIPTEIAGAILAPSSVADVAKVQAAVDSYITQQSETNQSALNSVNTNKGSMA
jgi:hypothetical protein